MRARTRLGLYTYIHKRIISNPPFLTQKPLFSTFLLQMKDYKESCTPFYALNKNTNKKKKHIKQRIEANTPPQLKSFPFKVRKIQNQANLLGLFHLFRWLCFRKIIHYECQEHRFSSYMHYLGHFQDLYFFSFSHKYPLKFEICFKRKIFFHIFAQNTISLVYFP